MQRLRVYIAGPLSQGDRKQNVEKAKHAAIELIHYGFAPLCPQLTDHLDPTDSLGQQTWYDVDLPWVSVADAVLRLPGSSIGADLECHLAQSLSIPVFSNIKSLCEAGITKGDPRFHALLQSLGRLHDQRQRDYGQPNDPFANIRGSSEWGIPSWVGAMIRATDKIRRIQKYAKSGHLANESVEDSFLDLAVYSIISLILYREERDHAGDSTV